MEDDVAHSLLAFPRSSTPLDDGSGDADIHHEDSQLTAVSEISSVDASGPAGQRSDGSGLPWADNVRAREGLDEIDPFEVDFHPYGGDDGIFQADEVTAYARTSRWLFVSGFVFSILLIMGLILILPNAIDHRKDSPHLLVLTIIVSVACAAFGTRTLVLYRSTPHAIKFCGETGTMNVSYKPFGCCSRQRETYSLGDVGMPYWEEGARCGGPYRRLLCVPLAGDTAPLCVALQRVEDAMDVEPVVLRIISRYHGGVDGDQHQMERIPRASMCGKRRVPEVNFGASMIGLREFG